MAGNWFYQNSFKKLLNVMNKHIKLFVNNMKTGERTGEK